MRSTSMITTTAEARASRGLLLALLALAMAFGCEAQTQVASGFDDPPPAATVGGEGGDVAAMVAAGEAGWANRDEESGLRAAIEGFAGAVASDPNQPDAWVMLARSHYLLADCHLAFDETKTEEKLSEYEAGKVAAERSLRFAFPEFAQRIAAGSPWQEALGANLLDASAVPALYWRASAMGKWASAEFATLLSYKDEIKAIMQTCLDLDGDYFYSGPSRYFGVFYGRAPAFAGGDLDQSRSFFETSLAEAPNYLGTRVLMAQDYAVKAQDRALFEQQLQTVIDADPEAGGAEIAPENRCEQRKAADLLSRADELFE